ncbi:MAG TPA: LysM domain-containing protein [Phototrophicaceae bacterium]|nr:LysM domain-containing protein [Phototrophicaceae bacterium]
MRRISIHLLFFAALLMVFAALPGVTPSQQAQSDPNGVCKAAQDKSVTAVNTSCKDLPEGFVCYGANGLEATPKTPTDNFFNFEGAKSPLEDVVSLQVTGVESSNQWGIGVINLGDSAVAAASDPYEKVQILLTGNARLEQTTSEEIDVKAFLFFTDRTTCSEAPATLVVHTPAESTGVLLNINGANITISSTVIFRTLPPGNVMQVYTVDGHAELEQPGNASSVTVNAGQTSVRCLSEPQNIGFDGQTNDLLVTEGCGWTTPQDATVEETEIATSIARLLGAPECANGGKSLVHTVARGETLARIAARYGVKIGDIAKDNGISNPDLIFVGMQLNINCGVDIGYTPFVGGGIYVPPVGGTGTR